MLASSDMTGTLAAFTLVTKSISNSSTCGHALAEKVSLCYLTRACCVGKIPDFIELPSRPIFYLQVHFINTLR